MCLLQVTIICTFHNVSKLADLCKIVHHVLVKAGQIAGQINTLPTAYTNQRTLTRAYPNHKTLLHNYI